MTPQNLAGLAIGVVFGFMLSWSAMVDPDVIRGALLFEEGYLFLFMGERPGRQHIVGSLIFGVGWGVSGACPGPIAAQIGQGIRWALLTLVGVVIGVRLFLARAECETEPACDHAVTVQPAPVAGRI